MIGLTAQQAVKLPLKPAEPPLLAITETPQKTLELSLDHGLAEITITEPVHFAGTYQINTLDLAHGDIELVAPDPQGAHNGLYLVEKT